MNNFIMTNNTLYYLVVSKINRLIVVHLVKGPCGGVGIMKLPYNNLFFHICQVHFKNPLFFSCMFFTFNTSRFCNLSWGIKLMHIKTKTLHLLTKLFKKFIKLVKKIYERKVEVNKQQWKHLESFQQA